MTSIVAQLIQDNLTVLGQGRALVQTLDAPGYCQNAPTLSLSGVGPHLRHVIDFYERFLGALESSDWAGEPVRIDYDARDRDPNVEVDPEHATRVIDRTRARLEALGQRLDRPAGPDRSPSAAREPRPLMVRSDGSPWVESNVPRELQSLISHTVHHFALIAIAVRSQGGDPGIAFGVAPSTLRHWEAERAGCGSERRS